MGQYMYVVLLTLVSNQCPCISSGGLLRGGAWRHCRSLQIAGATWRPEDDANIDATQNRGVHERMLALLGFIFVCSVGVVVQQISVMTLQYMYIVLLTLFSNQCPFISSGGFRLCSGAWCHCRSLEIA